MKYQGPLYGKIGRKCFDTGKTSDDWDALEAAAARRLELLRAILAANAAQNMLPGDLNDRLDAELSQSAIRPTNNIVTA